MTAVSKEWFGEWFNSPYYHILYKNRNLEEAQKFIDNLISHFKIDINHKVLDLACGKGRHSIYINKKGFDVVGVDLSAESIKYAKQFENEKLHFHIHDMREIFRKNEFDVILNMFTSFGYFKTEAENEQAICAVAAGLKPKGSFLMDFLNPHKVIKNLQPFHEKEIGGIHFKIRKKLSDDGFIIKYIEFSDEGRDYIFHEHVKVIYKESFLRYFSKAGLKTIQIFGDYDLNPYDKETSDRMIFVTQNAE
ncbi:SAM-dependent methyltransferase [Fulvivirga ligni]|uniref:SAM-dependent methyltransferase n=1 Tax=Fulvivirga ligni TaxID=2904246 RepID=UPI001F409D9F|nr:class I SAM-dependent methyltransferase [Fulvivirga ligni]UII22487.1 class I SAM-dependent methyltransferase [Fulvivirga ligni]